MGFTLMEVIVSLFVVMTLTLGIYSLVIMSLNITADNKNYVEAIEIANQKMEQIRNMPYKEVGVIGGIPAGTMPQEETLSREGNFTVNNYVTYFDDPADGQAGSTTPDTIPNDYKIVSVKVSWMSKAGTKSITVFSKIIPRTVETSEGYGLLKISVNDASAIPLAGANVRVVNNLVNPPIDVVNLTDSRGELYLPATSSYQGYEITVTKTDEEPLYYYGKDQTYATSTGKSPFHLTVSEGFMTTEAFTIDKLAHLEIRTVTADLPENWRVNEPSPSRQQLNPRVARDGSDNLYFTWQSQDTASSFVYVQKYDSSETKQWASDHKISTTPNQTNPDIVTTAAGESFVVWQDNSSSLKALTYVPNRNQFAAIDSGSRSPNTAVSAPIELARNQGIYGNRFASLVNRFLAGWRTVGELYDYFNLKLAIFNQSNRANEWIIDLKNDLNTIVGNLNIQPVRAVGSIVQTTIGSPERTSHTLTATFDNQPAAGNVLIAIAVQRNSWDSFGLPYNAAGNFTESVYSDANASLDVGIWHKVAGAGEPQQISLTSSDDINGGVMMLLEVSGLDTSDLVDVTAKNDQTGWDSFTATTGSTPPAEGNGFAVAAITYGDNDFYTPNSSNWSSISSDHWTQQLWRDWYTGNDGSLAVATMNISASAQQRATLTLSGSDNEERNSAMVVYRLYDPDDAAVSATGTQIASVVTGTNDVYIGGKFAITDLTGSRNVTGIILSEYGSIDAQNDLDNIRLYYDLDTSAPYDCGSESFSGSEAQFGATDSDGFSNADGTSAFSDAVQISTTKTLCLYPVMDVGTGAAKGETIEISIDDPANDISLSSGTMVAGGAVPLDGATLIDIPAELHQDGYIWRNDDGGEGDASWKEAENTDTKTTREATIRLRFELSNRGSLASAAVPYRLEYGERLTTCAAAAWTAVPSDNSRDWEMSASSYFSDGDPTSEQLSNPSGYTFQPGQIKQNDNQTGGLVLPGEAVTEVEYSIEATVNASDNPYCFRVTNGGSAIDAYDVYPEASIIGDDNVYITGLDANGNELWAVKRVNADNSSANQSYPRIALSEVGGTATTAVVWQDSRSGNWDIYAQSFDVNGNKLWNGGSDLAITASSTNEYSPVVAIGPDDGVVIAWVEDTPGGSVIYLGKYDLSDGSGLWPHAFLAVSSIFDVDEPSIAVDASNNIYLAYTETAAGINTAYLAKYDPTGSQLWDVPANTEAAIANQKETAVALDSSGIYITWSDNRENNYDIYTQKYDFDGNSAWSEDQRINIDLSTSTESLSALIIDSAGTPHAVWQDGRDGNENIYATAFGDPDALAAAPNIPLTLRGTKTISETPKIYEYNRLLTTDANGRVTVPLEWDTPGYYAEIASTSPKTIKLRDPAQPLELMPDQDQTWVLYIE